MNLYLKYRPQTFDQIVGNETVVVSVQGMLQDRKTCPHSFLLHGETGCGKTTLGRIIATGLNCKGSDLREVDSGQFRGIDTIREIRSQCQFKPLEGDCRVWILDEVHQLSKDAMSALLKILEDTPEHVYFILCTTEPQKLLPTIRGRCSEFQLKTLSDGQMLTLLRTIVHEEGQTLTKIVYNQIIQDSFGHPRNALQILDQVLRVEPEKQLETAQRQAELQSQSIELCRLLMKKAGWKEVRGVLTGLKDQEPESIRRHILGYCQSVLLNGDNDLAARIIEEFLEPLYNTGFTGLVYGCYAIIKN